MAAAVPAKLKDAQISAFASRAAQLDKHKPIIAYWLRFYMTQKIIAKNLHLADAECTTYTTDLMETLETTKAQNPTDDALLDEVVAYAYCEQFALQVFSKGDNEVRGDKVTKATADTFLAAATFLEMLSVWKNPLEPEAQSKLKYAKYHAARILRAIKAGEDPNASNPKQETPAVSPAALNPNDPEVQNIRDGAAQIPTDKPYQPYVESAPDTSAQPSPSFPAQRVASPPILPSAPTGYSQPSTQTPFSSHDDVSPISQPTNSRQGSVASIGGGYFPRVDVPTFTAETAAPSLPTAPSIVDEPMTNPYDASPTPQSHLPPSAPPLSDAQSFYQAPVSPPPVQPVQSPPVQPHQPTFVQPQHLGSSSPPLQNPFQPNSFLPPPQQQYNPQALQPPPAQPPPQTYHHPVTQAPHVLHQGPFKTDEDSIIEAQKRAKWAISALNFEDVNTAVKELRNALKSLGAN